MSNVKQVDELLQGLELAQPVISRRDDAYNGIGRLRYTADEVKGDLKNFAVNINRLAINAVAERMRIKRLTGRVGVDSDRSAELEQLARYSRLEHLLQCALIESMTTGVAYLVAWVDSSGHPRIWVEDGKHMWARLDESGDVVDAVKRWYDKEPNGVVTGENVVHYTADTIVTYRRGGNSVLEVVDTVDNPFGVVPVFPLINSDRPGDDIGYSVLDDLAPITAALSKVLADMLVTSESVARPRRWASGIPLEEDEGDGFTADSPESVDAAKTPVKAPFADGEDMFVTESTEAKFGQLAGADLGGYERAVNVLVAQIEAISGLPGHQLGVQTANPTSADAIRASESSLTARADSRIRILGVAVENCLRMLLAMWVEADFVDVDVTVRWASTATRSHAQEADAATKLYSLGIIDRDEARDMLGLVQ